MHQQDRGDLTMHVTRQRQSYHALQDRNIILWNPRSGVRVKTYVGHGYDVRDASVSSDNAKFASCGGDKQASYFTPVHSCLRLTSQQALALPLDGRSR